LRYYVLASDYDGTLAHDGIVDSLTIEAVRRLKATGRKFVLVTGRIVSDLLSTFPEASICDCIVAENGAVLYDPQTQKQRPLADPPPQEFIHALMQRNVKPLEIGKVIVATVEPQEQTVMEVIRELGLELQIIFNKGAVMILPSGINKASGLTVAMKEMGYSLEQVVGIGDAENDHAFLGACGFSVAVSNSVEALKKTANYVSPRDHGKGVIEIIESIIRSDLQELNPVVSKKLL
jgi:hydroxymethylpyrimidine pyrophosphatase-like HAD family hydrolase